MTFNNQSDPIEEMFDRAGPLWSEEEIAKLFELKPEDNAFNSPSQVQEPVSIASSSPGPNLPKDEESEKLGITAQDLIGSEDNPHENQTKPTFASNPFAKFGAVGLMMAGIFSVGAIFLNGVMNTPIGRAPSSIEEETPEPVASQPNSDASQDEIGELKTQLAIGQQSQQLEDWSQRRRQRVPTGVESPESLQDEEQEAEELPDLPEPERTSPAPRPSILPEPSPALGASSRPAPSLPPAVRPAQSVRPQTPRLETIQEPTPKPEPIIEEPLLEPEPIPEPIEETEVIPESQPEPVPEEIDPMQQYALLGALGSYGQMPVPEISHLEEVAEVAQGNTIPVAELVQPYDVGVQSLPQEQNILGAASIIQPLPEEQTILAAKEFQLVNTPDDMGITAWTQNEPTQVGVKSSSVSGTPAQNAQNQLQIGRTLLGELVTSLWANPSEPSSELFVVKLTTPLTSTDGTMLFPVGTQVIFETSAIASNGVVEASAIALVDGHQEYRLPSGVLSIQGENGQPLIARQRSASSEGVANRDARAFGMGALARVGDVLSQPDISEQFSSSGGFSSTQYSRSQRRGGWQSITGAALSGGFSALSQRLEERERLALEQLSQQSPLWMVKAGTTVTLFINGTFEFRP